VRWHLTYWVAQIQQAHVDQIAAAETLAVEASEVGGKVFDECLAVFGAEISVLFKLDDVPPDLPVGFNELGVDGLHGTDLALGVGVGNLAQQVSVSVGWLRVCFAQFHTASIFLRCSVVWLATLSRPHAGGEGQAELGAVGAGGLEQDGACGREDCPIRSERVEVAFGHAAEFVAGGPD